MPDTQHYHHARLAALFRGEALDRPFSLRRIDQNPFLDATQEGFDAWLATTRQSLEQHAEWFDHETTYHPAVVEFWPLGVHFVDAVLGARVYRHDDQYWTELLPGDLAELRPVDVPASPLVSWSLAMLGQALGALPEGVALTTPVFSSPLNTAVNLFGERALSALAAPTADTLRGLRVITDTIVQLHLLFRCSFPEDRVRFYASSFRYAPDGFGHICGCSTQLVGPDTYARYLAPLDEAILASYPEGGTIHLCGRHTHHIPCWRDMRCVRGLEMNDAAADDFPSYFEGLREDQVIYIAPNPRIPVERILEISGGRRVILQTLMSPT